MDLIRFAAAVMVVFFHLSWRSEAPDIGLPAGWVGVEIFFVISGFVIMGSAAGASVGRFARKRFARLYPAAIGCALINLAFLIPYADLATRYGLVVSASPSAFVASIVLIKGPFLVGALWTLPIEIGFYALVGVLIWCGWIRRPTRIAAALIAWSGLYLVPFCLSQYGLLPFRVPSPGYGLLNLTMLRHGCFFGVGMLLWVIAQRGAPAAARWPHLLLFAGIALCVVEIVARVAELRGLYAHPVGSARLLVESLAAFLLAVAGIWLSTRFNETFRPGTAGQTVMHRLGLMTYPLYLMHEGVGGVTFSLLRASGYGQGIALLAGLALSLAAAWLVVIALEPWLEPRLTGAIDRLIARFRPARA